MTRVVVLCYDAPLCDWLVSELAPHVGRVLCPGAGEALPAADAYVVDTDTVPRALWPDPTAGTVLCMGWGREKPEGVPLWVERPFRGARLRALLGLAGAGGSLAPLPLPEERAVWLDGRKVPLSACEYRLFDVLYRAEGAWVSREELHRAVWGEAGDTDTVNVYVHYLRRKLEADGIVRIRSARGKGYRLQREEPNT